MGRKLSIADIRYLRSKYEGIQLRPKELYLISKAVLKYSNCNLLVFGLGYDTPFWLGINNTGRTIFLEDSKEWFDEINRSYPDAEAYLVTYPCKIAQWQTLLNKPSELEIQLPIEISNMKWDVILVDAPSGAYGYNFRKYGIEPPGRMISIYMASKLIESNGDIFVHDCDRIVERVYSDHYLFDKNFVTHTGTNTILRQYKGS